MSSIVINFYWWNSNNIHIVLKLTFFWKHFYFKRILHNIFYKTPTWKNSQAWIKCHFHRHEFENNKFENIEMYKFVYCTYYKIIANIWFFSVYLRLHHQHSLLSTPYEIDNLNMIFTIIIFHIALLRILNV